jgi:hypothetical protein
MKNKMTEENEILVEENENKNCFVNCLDECIIDCCVKPKKVEYRCYFLGLLPFFYISDCIRCGICVYRGE